MEAKEQAVFLEALAEHGIVSKAAEAAHISRSAVYRLRNSDPTFAEAWSHAKEEATDKLATVVHQRAINGIEEVRYFKGEPIGTVRRYSDQLLMFLLRAYRPSVFGTKQQHPEEQHQTTHDQARQSLIQKMASLHRADDD